MKWLQQIYSVRLRKVGYISLVFLFGLIAEGLALKCICNPKECEIVRTQDCPGKGMVIWDPCKCCKVCAKTLGEACGGPGGFSGTCEPPLQCVQRLQMKGSGVCLELPSRARKLKCAETIALEPGCAIISGRCKCMGRTDVCKDSLMLWDFKNLEECQLNLENLIRGDVDFDEDYPVKVPSRHRGALLRSSRR